MMDTTETFYRHANNLRARFAGNAPRPIADGELALTAALLTLADAVASGVERSQFTVEDAP